MKAQIQYLHHSGFAVKTERHYLVFDYDGTNPGPDQTLLAEPGSIIFVSHRHEDHYWKDIAAWQKKYKKLQYVMSHDVPCPKKGGMNIYPNETKTVDGATVTALTSTDEGVAFLVEVDGLTIYHAGDLNWWHWSGETAGYNANMSKSYRDEIRKLRGKIIDIAFVPVDPRLEQESYLLGLDYLMQTAEVKQIFPMHFGDDYRIFDWLKADPKATSYLNRIAVIEKPGQIFSY